MILIALTTIDRILSKAVDGTRLTPDEGVALFECSDLQKLGVDVVDLAALKSAGVVSHLALRAKVILAGEIKRKLMLKGLLVSKGARAAIEAAGGNVELPAAPQPAGKLKPKAGGEAAPAGRK